MSNPTTILPPAADLTNGRILPFNPQRPLHLAIAPITAVAQQLVVTGTETDASTSTAYTLSTAGGYATDLSDDATSYIERDESGAVSLVTPGFTPGKMPMYRLIVANRQIVSIVDCRNLAIPAS
jgi:hypothetical protein